MKKLTLILDETNWLEATWVEETITINEVEGEEVESKETSILWCESYSGHKEHITMLRNKALEFGTSLDEYEDLITECESKFIYPTDEELQAEEIAMKVQEYKNYLASTDYKMIVDYFATLSKDEQDALIKERAEKREFVRLNEGAK